MGLEATAALWPPIQAAYPYVQRAAHLLTNPDHVEAAVLQQTSTDFLVELRLAQASWGTLASAGVHFQKVTASYWPGLFHCYAVADLPRTNNDLEQYFGAARHLERRATGRKSASPALVVRGAVRVVAAVATRLQPLSAAELRPPDVPAWWALRRQAEARHATRRDQARFRRDPRAYLAGLEEVFLKPALSSYSPYVRREG